MSDESQRPEKHSSSAEKWISNTRQTFEQLTGQATRYTSLIQKKIDLALLNKKIPHAQAELGRAIDKCRESGEADIIGNAQVQTTLKNLDSLKASAATLATEIEALQHPAENSNTTKEKDTEQ